MDSRVTRAIVGLIIIGLVVYWQFGLLQYGKGYTASDEATAIYEAMQKGEATDYLEDEISGHFDVISFKESKEGKVLTIKIDNSGNKATEPQGGSKVYTRYIYKYGGLLLATSEKLKFVEWQTVDGDSPGVRTCTVKTYYHLSHTYTRDYIKKYAKSAKGLQELMDKSDEMQKIE